MLNELPLFSSMHNHTVFCDGKDDVETMCRAAYEKKLYSIGFSSHAPIFNKTGIKADWVMSDDKLNEYVSEVNSAKQRWQGKINVFLGLEVDYIKGLRSAVDDDITAVNSDYLIGSVHYIVPPNGSEPFTVDGPEEEFTGGLKNGFGGDALSLMNCYYDAQAEMITLGGFDILGHADIIRKNSEGKNLWPQEKEIIRQKEIARLAGEKGITAEVNTGGINRGGFNDVYPSVSFLKILRENNVPVIITADAHCTQHVDGNYNIALQRIIYAGFTEHVIFFGKNNENIKWHREKIRS
jgi:histidinol-phosphatase (PHP family)